MKKTFMIEADLAEEKKNPSGFFRVSEEDLLMLSRAIEDYALERFRAGEPGIYGHEFLLSLVDSGVIDGGVLLLLASIGLATFASQSSPRLGAPHPSGFGRPVSLEELLRRLEEDG